MIVSITSVSPSRADHSVDQKLMDISSILRVLHPDWLSLGTVLFLAGRWRNLE